MKMEMRKIVCIVIAIVGLLVALAGLFFIMNGSLEQMPTAEQIEKAHITGWVLLAIGILADIFAAVRVRNK